MMAPFSMKKVFRGVISLSVAFSSVQLVNGEKSVHRTGSKFVDLTNDVDDTLTIMDRITADEASTADYDVRQIERHVEALKTPSDISSNVPSVIPSTRPSEDPSLGPSNAPSVSNKPYTVPSMGPSTRPSEEFEPSFDPGNTPSTLPSVIPSTCPLEKASFDPGNVPFAVPSLSPSTSPSERPTYQERGECEDSFVFTLNGDTSKTCDAYLVEKTNKRCKNEQPGTGGKIVGYERRTIAIPSLKGDSYMPVK